VLERRELTTFIGVDLGGGKGKNTAVALLARDRGDGRAVRVVFVDTKTADGQPFFDAELLRFVRAHRERALVAIDAPLLPSVCLRCRLEHCATLGECQDPVVQWFRALEESGLPAAPSAARGPGLGGPPGGKPATTPYTQRACEVILHRRHGILPRETLGQGMGPLTARAHYLRRALEPDFALNQNLLEVYPKATVHALCGPDAARRYKRLANTWRVRAEILERLSGELRFEVWREGCLQSDHCFDAVMCAYTAFLWARDGWTMPQEDRAVFERDGWIWFPPIK
jgi:predicted nuclease with RNAse H fold